MIHELSDYTFQKAGSPEEFAEIYRLNHRIFAEEVGQHEPTRTGLLVDRFDRKNVYFIAKQRDRLAGMISVNGQPPFSVASKLEDPAVLDSLGSGLLEVRLLAIEPTDRNRRVLAGLLYAVLSHGCDGGYTHLIISGVREQLRMYERLGFRKLGPAVAAGKAEFTPMVLRISDIPVEVSTRWRKTATRLRPVSLLPGPVQISPAVQLAFSGPPVSHRGPGFITKFEEVRGRLRELSGGMEVALFPGSGTLANDVVGAAIAADSQAAEGLVLTNGEFGCRLAKHAIRWRLPHQVMPWEWGSRWDLRAVAAHLDEHPAIRWIWAVQLETSTGIMNDTRGLVALAEARGVSVYLDCVSSFGAMEPDLRGVALATTVSGKSIGAYGGVAIVLVREKTIERYRPELFPPSLDLPAALRSRGPLMTFPSAMMKALREALNAQGADTWKRYAELGRFVRSELRAVGREPLVDGPDAAPVISTFTLNGDESAPVYMKRCAVAGFAIGGDSDYLRKRNWLQIATMGDVKLEDLAPLFGALR